MKKIITFVFLTIHFVSVFGQNMTEDQQQLVADFINCFKNRKTEQLMKKVAFPFHRQYPIPAIKNEQEFLKRYNEVFDEKLCQLIAESGLNKDWSAHGWQGIMFMNGQIWLDYDGRLITVNYESAFESKKRAELIQAEKKQLHASVRKFKEPVLILETSNYIVRIDDMGDYNYRYSSWKTGNKMSTKPDLILLKGERVAEGSGGNHSYVFTKGAYKYICEIIVLGEEDETPAKLIIYKGEKEILSQKAGIVNQN